MNDISTSGFHPYLLLFNRHVEQLQKHLSGFCSPLPSTDSLVGGVLWTAGEKNKFFHALSVHSRLRPDLIAACVGTKNEAEVLEYLLLLEDGSRKTRLEENLRATSYSAREVSDSWITWEEANAERLRLNEAIWDEGSRIDGEDSQPRDEEESIESGYPEIQPLGGLKRLTYAHLHVLGDVLQADENHGPDADMVASPSIENALPMATGMDLISLAQVSSRSSSETSNNGNNGSNSYQELQVDPEFFEENAPAPPQNLSPRSRRRYQKRIHMRRKRALLKRKETDLTTHKLKTGPRKNTGEKDSPEASPLMITRNLQIEIGVKNTKTISKDVGDQTFTIGPGEDDGNDPSLDQTRLRGRHVTARSDLSLHNVSLDAITATGLDIFNYPKMGKLLQHFLTGYGSDVVDQSASISTETCILLLEILKDFIVQLISRVITLEEEHQRLRGTTKVWRKKTDDTEKGVIDSSAIQFALKSMGMFEENLSQFFMGLLGEDCHPVTYNQTGYEDNERLVNRPNVLNQHPLHQDVCLPHYHSNLFPDYCHPDHPDESTNKLQEEVDDKTLLNEMQEEGELEREDEVADQQYEIGLWREIRKRKR